MKIRSIYTSICFASLLLCSCNDWLTVEPKDKVAEDDMFSTVQGYESVLNGVYRNMAETSLYGDFLSLGAINVMSYTYDVSTSKDKLSLQAAKYRYEDAEFKAASQKLWSTAYNCIANANNLIQRLESAPDHFFDEELDQKNLMLGEAYAARAYIHFDLLRLYTPAPPRNTYDESTESKPEYNQFTDNNLYIPYVDYYPCKFASRMTIKEVLNKIVADVQKARKHLAWDTTSMGMSNFSFQWDPANSGKTANKSFYGYRATRLNYYGATALLARVLLYRNAAEYEDPEHLEGEVTLSDREMAYTMANKVKTKTTYRFEQEKNFSDPLDKRATIKLTKELVFALWNENQKDVVQNYYSSLAKNYMLADYKNLYEKTGNTNDFRTRYFTYKTEKGERVTNRWWLSSNNTKEWSIIPMIRYSEICYIMADAIFEKDKPKAIAALRATRVGRNLSQSLNAKMTRKEFYNLLIEDARKEFAGEGKMFFLYKQLNRKVVISADEEIDLGGKFTLPIPDSEFILK